MVLQPTVSCLVTLYCPVHEHEYGCQYECGKQGCTDSCNVYRWIPDELGVSSFAQLDDLKTIPVTSFDARFDIWHVEAPLSDGCGGPELPEEVIL